LAFPSAKPLEKIRGPKGGPLNQRGFVFLNPLQKFEIEFGNRPWSVAISTAFFENRCSQTL